MRIRSGRKKTALLPTALAAFAVALLSLLVFYSFRMPDAVTPLEQNAEISPGNSITEGRFAGLTNDGTTILVDTTTMNAALEDNARSDATGIQVSLATQDGKSYRAEAREGLIDPAAGSAQISGDAVLSAGGEFFIRSEGFWFSLEQTRFSSLDTVHFRFPGGRGQADLVQLLAADGASSSSRLEFSRNVIVVYNLSDK